MEKLIIDVNGSRTTEEILAAGNYAVRYSEFNGENFPMRPMPKGLREIVYLQFDHEITSVEVLAEAERQGLERPRYEDAFFFGEQHPGEIWEGVAVLFLHEPWQKPHGSLQVTVLRRVGIKVLCLEQGALSCTWTRKCRFAFVRKS